MFVIKRDHEEIGVVQSFQDGLAAASSGDRVAQPGGQPIQDRCLEQKVPQGLWLLVQHLLDEVIQDEVVTARERP